MKKPIPRQLFFVLTAAAAVLAGCSTAKFQEDTLRPVERSKYERPVQLPEPGVTRTAQVGETLVNTSIVALIPALKTTRSQRVVTRYRDDMRMAIDLPQGDYVLVGTNQNQTGHYYAAPGGVLLSYETKGIFDTPELLSGGIFVDPSGARSVYWYWRGYTTASLHPTPDIEAAPAKPTPDTKAAVFRRELVYTGSAQSTLTLLYREFYKDMARPAFSQELKYDIARDQVIGYKGARIEVINSGNTSITYRVITPLADSEM